MKIPFIQHIGIGLHISQEAIRWVKLSRLHDRINIQNIDCEEVQHGDIAESLDTLVKRQKPSFPYVSVNIDQSHYRQQLLDVPYFDEPEFFNHWIDEQKEKLIPEGVDPQQFISNYHLLGSEGDQKCLFILTRKEALENRKELLKSVGLRAVIITTGQLQAGYGFIFDEVFVSEESCLLSIFEDGASLQFYQNGLLENFSVLSHSGASIADIIEEAKTYLATKDMGYGKPQSQSIYLAKSKFLDVRASNSDLPVDKIYQGQPLSSIASDEKVTSDYSVAAGLAVKQLYPALDTINLQDEETLDSIKSEMEKKDALHMGVALGGLVVLTYFILLIGQFFLHTKLEEAEQKVALLQDDINTVKVATEKVEELKQRAGQARRLVAERTSMAKTLEFLGQSLPDRVWYNEVFIKKSEDRKEAAIYGYAHNDALIASLMERLEKKNSTDNVRLIYSEAVNSVDIYKDISFDHIPLVQFEIRVSLES